MAFPSPAGVRLLSELEQEPGGGNILNGTSLASPRAELTDAGARQLRLTHDGTNFADLRVDAGGALNLDVAEGIQTTAPFVCGRIVGQRTDAGFAADFTNHGGPQLYLQNMGGSQWTTLESGASGDLIITPQGGDTTLTGNVVISGSVQAGSYVGLPSSQPTAPLGLGPDTAPPARNLDVGDPANPQIRLTNVAGTYYTDLFAGPSGGLRILPSAGMVGINVSASPARALEVQDATNPQLRLSQAGGTNYADIQVTSAGNLLFMPSGSGSVVGRVGINAAPTPTAFLQVAGTSPPSVATTPGTSATPLITTTAPTGGDTTIATTGAGGQGANITIQSGAGGRATSAATQGNGGGGGTLTFSGGQGGSQSLGGSAVNVGGSGGIFTITGGQGGNAQGASSGQNSSGPGGALNLTGGQGGVASGGSGANNANVGGAVNITGGQGGNGAGANGAGGSVVLNGGDRGAGAGSAGAVGNVRLCNTRGYVSLGNVTPTVMLHSLEALAIASNPADGYASAFRQAPGYTAAGAQTVTRHNYFDLLNPSPLTNVTVTDACIMRFDAAAGTHKAVAAGSTKTTPGTVNAWLKVNINSALFFIPCYSSMTT